MAVKKNSLQYLFFSLVLLFIIVFNLQDRISKSDTELTKKENPSLPNVSADKLSPQRILLKKPTLPFLFYVSPQDSTSSSWLSSIIALFTMELHVSVDVLLNSPTQIEELSFHLRSLKRSPCSLRLLDPWRSYNLGGPAASKRDPPALILPIAPVHTHPPLRHGQLLTTSEALERLEYLSSFRNYTAVVLRGDDILRLALTRPALQSKLWAYSKRGLGMSLDLGKNGAQKKGSHQLLLESVLEKTDGRVIFETLYEKKVFQLYSKFEEPRFLILPPVALDSIRTVPRKPETLFIDGPAHSVASKGTSPPTSSPHYSPLKRLRFCTAAAANSFSSSNGPFRPVQLLKTFAALQKLASFVHVEYLVIETPDLVGPIPDEKPTEGMSSNPSWGSFGEVFDELREEGRRAGSTVLLRTRHTLSLQQTTKLLETECDFGVHWIPFVPPQEEIPTLEPTQAEVKLPSGKIIPRASRYGVDEMALGLQQVGRLTLLPYSLSGLPVFVPPLSSYQSLLALYPYYFDGTEENLISTIKEALPPHSLSQSPQTSSQTNARSSSAEGFLFLHSSKRVLHLLKSFTYDALFHRHIVPVLNREQLRPGLDKSILFAGNDLSLSIDLIDSLAATPGVEVRVDLWKGTDLHDKKRSSALAEWADIVWIEACSDTALYYSKMIDPTRQKLILRYHWAEGQQKHGVVSHKIVWESVSHLLFSSPHVQAEVVPTLPLDRSVTTVLQLDSFLNTRLYGIRKQITARRTLGLLGFLPKRKQPKMAVDILVNLIKLDPQSEWQLRLAGDSLHAAPYSTREDLNYYRAFNHSIAALPMHIQNKIHFDGWVTDIPGWLSKIGFILSTSSAEGTPQAIIEGMASGAIPIIHNWAGADTVFPEADLFENPLQAAKQILNIASNPESFSAAQARTLEYAKSRFDSASMIRRIHEELLGIDSITEEPVRL